MVDHGVICYTVGATRSYDEALEAGPVRKIGRGPDYVGGIVWASKREAEAGIPAIAGHYGHSDFSVYEVRLPARWDQCTYAVDGNRHLCEDARVVRRVALGASVEQHPQTNNHTAFVRRLRVKGDQGTE